MNFLAITALVIIQLSPLSGAKMPRNNILGIRLDMLRGEAHLVLGRKQGLLEVDAHGSDTAGSLPILLSPETEAEELWRLEDGHFSQLEIFYDPITDRVRRVTAVARTDGRPLRYDSVGDLKRAVVYRPGGYAWAVPRGDGKYAYVLATGRHPDYVTSITLFDTRDSIAVLPASRHSRRISNK
jgi:hypothetical protein